MAERRCFTVKNCNICRAPIEQAAKGRPRLTCSDACRQARYRSGKGKTSRRERRIGKQVKKRRSVPFGERSFDTRYREPVLELSYRRWVYECVACGEPYLVERIKSGAKVSPYCSEKCEQKSNYHWTRFNDAIARSGMIGKRLDERVWERFDYQKLSPLCPQCKIPFAPNTTLHGQKKRGRPRKYCSDACRKLAYEKRWKRKHQGKPRGHRFGECLDCGERIDRINSAGRRGREFCDEICAGRFKQRAYKARLKMKEKGITQFVRGVSGHGAAARSARKNRRKAETFCNKNETLASGKAAEVVCSEGV
jgi:hypothetical protein